MSKLTGNLGKDIQDEVRWKKNHIATMQLYVFFPIIKKKKRKEKKNLKEK